MRRRAERARRQVDTRTRRERYGRGPTRLLYHGTAGVLADSVAAEGLRTGVDGRVYLTACVDTAYRYAVWSTGLAAAVPGPAPPAVTDVGRAVAGLGSHIATVALVRLPLDSALAVEDAFPPPLPWEHVATAGECFYLREPVAACAISGWRIHDVAELHDPTNRRALTAEADLIAAAFPRINGGDVDQGFTTAIPDPAGLWDAVTAASPNAASPWHGQSHWLQVANVGVQLLRAGGDAHPPTVFLFALLHDSQRQAEGNDPDHGARAARLARQLAGQHFHLEPDQLDILCNALARHDRGQITEDPTIGVCWDADRLTLSRLSIEPDPDRLSTSAGRSAAAGFVARPSDWRCIVYRYHLASVARDT
jgi:uncharacterized protein